MRGVILAAGRGSRMGETTDDVPKAFLEVEGRTLYERQRAALAGVADAVTVVLGYEAETARERLSSVENRDERSPTTDTVVLDDWDEYDNAESLRRALVGIDEDALVLNGDVVLAPRTLGRMVRRFEEVGPAYNVVGCLPGVQNDHTAIRCDDADEVTDYGEIPGHRHAGVGVVARRNLDDATDVLACNADDWYPHLYPETPTKRVVVSPDAHLEINRPADLERARERLPLARSSPVFSRPDAVR
ncbi:NTP transferase domain-containing protein [Halorussus sp. MSC15.2]|uniref:NTP transferase domain-containing protein n=1 Tax=Halorussus sp. MSC15.2 TaxID=2283638 RepID=UPI0013D21389|nr:NTP transferase domain-containing protein [Halorussus sp. MSC15.2]NEU56312.1 NTP transferase domain-containing protein [Halorussus sp. MSC15.2]